MSPSFYSNSLRFFDDQLCWRPPALSFSRSYVFLRFSWQPSVLAFNRSYARVTRWRRKSLFVLDHFGLKFIASLVLSLVSVSSVLLRFVFAVGLDGSFLLSFLSSVHCDYILKNCIFVILFCFVPLWLTINKLENCTTEQCTNRHKVCLFEYLIRNTLPKFAIVRFSETL